MHVIQVKIPARVMAGEILVVESKAMKDRLCSRVTESGSLGIRVVIEVCIKRTPMFSIV